MMVFGFPYWQVVLGVGAGLLVLLLVVWGYFQYKKKKLEHEIEELVAESENDDEDGQIVDYEPPKVRKGIIALLKQWRHRAKAAKLAEKGYVRWYKVGSTMSRPKWVKPTFEGTGEAEYYDRGDKVTYLFPKDAMLPDARTGAWVAIHREDEADPVNLRDPLMPSVPADRLQEIINLEAESDKPGLLDRYDIDMTTAFILLTVVLFIIYAASTVMSGGL